MEIYTCGYEFCFRLHFTIYLHRCISIMYISISQLVSHVLISRNEISNKFNSSTSFTKICCISKPHFYGHSNWKVLNVVRSCRLRIQCKLMCKYLIIRTHKWAQFDIIWRGKRNFYCKCSMCMSKICVIFLSFDCRAERKNSFQTIN